MSKFNHNQHENDLSEHFREMPSILQAVVERIDNIYTNDALGGVTGIPSGFTDLDEKTSGLQPGELVVVAARPAMGKTAFAMNIVEHVVIEASLPVAVFSMAMSSEQLVQRSLGSVGRLDSMILRTGKLGDEDWQKLTYAIGKLADVPLYIDDTPRLSVSDIRARACDLADQHGGRLGLIVIDYLQLMSGTGRTDNRAIELGEISRELKILARELRVPIVALSQLSRNVEQRVDKRPIVSDLRDSGAIEEDADLILFLYRDEYYNADSPDRGMAELIIGKHRNGPTGKVRLAFLGHYAKFDNAAIHGVTGWADADG